MKKYLTLIMFVFLTSWSGLQAEEEFFSNTPPPDPIQIELLNENQTIQPGQPFWVAIQCNVEEGWHAYWKNPGDTGSPTSIEWVLPPGFTAGPTEWPFPQRFDLNSVIGFGYEGGFWLLTPITPPPNLSKNTPIEISANVEWLVCSESNCVPGTTTTKTSLTVDSAVPKPRDDQAELFAKARAHLPQKEWAVQADCKDGLVTLHVQPPENSNYTAADFFPEQKQSIDPKGETLWTPDAEHPGQYIMTLKEKEEETPHPKDLKGVLVLHQPDDESKTIAVEVNTPLKGEISNDHLLSLADEENGEHAALQDPAQLAFNSAIQFDGGVGLALIFAFAGGLLLNLMPCVLPVVSFKILSFVKLAGQNRSVTLKHGLSFSFGVILSFWVLATLLLILQAYGRSVGWGFQLQEPLFVAGLASLLFIFSLSSFGVFELGTSLTTVGSQAPSPNSGLAGSFFSGILATVVATPCTGPFLGTAIGFAVTLPAFSALMIFTSLGLGMSLPYLLLAAFPPLLRFLPKPGNWMVTFKELMGFVMLATVIWLVWVFGAQTNNLALTLLLGGFFFLSLGCWMFGKWGTPVHSLFTRRFTYVLVALSFFMGGYIIYSSTSSPLVLASGASSKSLSAEQEWEEFSEERIAELQKQGIPVFVDFTAKWCLICQANHYILTTDAVAEKFEQLGVVKMKADWTKHDKKITEALRKFGRNGIPLYLLYGANSDEPPAILPQVLTIDVVADYLNKIDPAIANGETRK